MARSVTPCARWAAREAASIGAGVVLAAGAAGAFAGCGANYQSVYEGDIRFEHCYRLDEDPATPVRRKWSCWREWNRGYTYGQSRERTEYGLARERALASARGAPTEGADRAPSAGVIACPMPTDAFAPPPPTLPSAAAQAPSPSAPAPVAAASGGSAVPVASARDTASAHDGAAQRATAKEGSRGAGREAAGDPSLAKAPGATCSEGCGQDWVRCGQSCSGDKCRAACDERYRACMHRCF